MMTLPKRCLFLVTLATLGLASPGGGGELPVFKGTVGHFKHTKAFLKFVETHEGKEVIFDVVLRNFDGEPGSFFVLWEGCDDLYPGERPTVAKCVGSSFNINNTKPDQQAGLFHKDGKVRLKGRFRVGTFSGPHQGLMGCGLWPLQ